jgi:O-antigen/teichoic acid export membrane protein
MLLGSFASLAGFFITTVLLAKILEPKTLGILLAAEAFVGIFIYLFDFGFRNSLLKTVNYKSDEFDLKQRLGSSMVSAFIIKTAIIIPTSLLIILIAKFSSFDQLTFKLILLFILTFALDSYTKIFGIARRVLGQFKLTAVINGLNKFIRLGAILFVLLILKASILTLVQFYVLSSALKLLIAALTTLRLVKPNFKNLNLLDTFKESFSYGLYDFIEDSQNKIDRISLNYLIGPSAVAFYSVPSKLNRVIKQIPLTVQRVFLPSLHENNALQASNYQLLSMLSKLLSLMGVVAFGAIFYFSKPVLMLLFADKYTSSIEIAPLFSFLALFWLYDTVPNMVLASQHRHQTRIVTLAILTCLNITLNIVLIPKLGLVAAVYSTILVNLIKLSVFTFASRQDLSYKVSFQLLILIPVVFFVKYWVFILVFLIYIITLKVVSIKEMKLLLKTFKRDGKVK